MKLSLKAMIVAGALFKAIAFLFISLLNLVLRPYGGAYLAILSSLYPGYDPINWPIAVIVGTLYSLLAGALAALPSAAFTIFSQNIFNTEMTPTIILRAALQTSGTGMAV